MIVVQHCKYTQTIELYMKMINFMLCTSYHIKIKSNSYHPLHTLLLSFGSGFCLAFWWLFSTSTSFKLKEDFYKIKEILFFFFLIGETIAELFHFLLDALKHYIPHTHSVPCKMNLVTPLLWNNSKKISSTNYLVAYSIISPTLNW